MKKDNQRLVSWHAVVTQDDAVYYGRIKYISLTEVEFWCDLPVPRKLRGDLLLVIPPTTVKDPSRQVRGRCVAEGMVLSHDLYKVWLHIESWQGDGQKVLEEYKIA